MTRTARDLSDIRLGDLQTFMAVQRTGSVNAAARELSTSASQVSKTISRLEHHLGEKLLSRSSRGVALTDFGRRTLPQMEEIAERFTNLPRLHDSTNAELSVAGESYLLSMCLPTIATCHPGLSVRALEMPTPFVRASAGDNFFEMALLASDTEQLPKAWETASLGRVRKGLFATPRLAKKLGPSVSPSALRSVPFVTPIFHVGGRYVTVDDGCPLSSLERRIGHRAQTMQMALDIAAMADQLVFGPIVAARLHVSAGTLVEVAVTGWREHQPLFLAYNTERVSVRVRDAVLRSLRDLFGKAERAHASITA